MVAVGRGHFVVLSSQADVLVQAEFPSYAASKAALSELLEGLGLALRPHGVGGQQPCVGFVDTKMRALRCGLFMYTLDQAVDVVESVLRKRPLRSDPAALHSPPLVRMLGRDRPMAYYSRGPRRSGIALQQHLNSRQASTARAGR